MAVHIEAGDVIKLILQFCKENALYNTLNALQEESQLSLNTVESLERFQSDITNGNWDSVLQTISTLTITVEKLFDLYEHIVLELLELKEIDTARVVLRNTKTMNKMKQEQPDRYLKLEKILGRGSFESRDYPGGLTKEKRRVQIAQALANEAVVVAPSRLMALLTQALKWQQHQGMLPPGTAFDLFRGTTPIRIDEEEKYPGELDKALECCCCSSSYLLRCNSLNEQFNPKSQPLCAKFPPSGQYLVTGSSDGFIEVWNVVTGKLLKDLKYQANNELMMHEQTSVLCLNFSSDSELLASGSADGKIKIWHMQTGKCVRRFESAHAGGVSCVTFTKEGSQVLSGSNDHTLRIHGLKSGKTLKIFRGHTSFVNDCTFNLDGTRVISASSDGTFKVWDTKTTDCISTFSPMLAGGQPVQTAIHNILNNPKNAEELILCNKSPKLFIVNMKGQTVKTFASGKAVGGDFVCCTVSPRGEWLYGIADDGTLYSFNMNNGKLEGMLKVCEKPASGLVHHPHINLMAVYNEEGVKLWKP